MSFLFFCKKSYFDEKMDRKEAFRLSGAHPRASIAGPLWLSCIPGKDESLFTCWQHVFCALFSFLGFDFRVWRAIVNVSLQNPFGDVRFIRPRGHGIETAAAPFRKTNE